MSFCYTQLDACSEQLKERPFSDPTAESMRKFIDECVDQANLMAQSAEDLNNLERARVLDIMFWAGDLGNRLRRSIRQPASIPVRLRVEEAGGLWEEDTFTQSISRHGALLECQHSMAVGQLFVFLRRDTGEQARARVAWRQPKDEGGHKLGIEFLDHANFWNLE